MFICVEYGQINWVSHFRTKKITVGKRIQLSKFLRKYLIFVSNKINPFFHVYLFVWPFDFELADSFAFFCSFSVTSHRKIIVNHCATTISMTNTGKWTRAKKNKYEKNKSQWLVQLLEMTTIAEKKPFRPSPDSK